MIMMSHKHCDMSLFGQNYWMSQITGNVRTSYSASDANKSISSYVGIEAMQSALSLHSDLAILFSWLHQQLGFFRELLKL